MLGGPYILQQLYMYCLIIIVALAIEPEIPLFAKKEKNLLREKIQRVKTYYIIAHNLKHMSRHFL